MTDENKIKALKAFASSIIAMYDEDIAKETDPQRKHMWEVAKSVAVEAQKILNKGE